LAASGIARKLRDVIPEGVGQIQNDRFGSAADDDPLEGKNARRIDFLVRKPRRNIDEIARVHLRTEFSPLAPANIEGATEYVGDRVLLAVMVASLCQPPNVWLQGVVIRAFERLRNITDRG
jgi:hypothetical protein